MTAYAGLADVWAADASLAYEPMARHLVGLQRGPLEGLLALDAGAGSGVAGRALQERGAEVVSVDREPDMAAYVASAGPAVAGDVLALPFREQSFDLVVAAFVLNHVADPVAGLRELRRVARPGGSVLASTFSAERASAKEAVDEVAQAHGFVRPAWYVEMQAFALAVGATGALEKALMQAGFSSWTVTEQTVDVGITRPEDVVRYRLGLPHLHAFAESLTERQRSDFVADAAAAVARAGAGFAPRVVEAVAVA